MSRFSFFCHNNLEKRKGYTLTEVVVTMLIFSIVMATIFLVVYTPTHISQILQNDINSTRKLQTIFDKITPLLIFAKDATAIDQVYNNINQVPDTFTGLYLYENSDGYSLYLKKSVDGTIKTFKISDNIDVSFTVNSTITRYPLPKLYVKVKLKSTDTNPEKTLESIIVLMNSYKIPVKSLSSGSSLEIDF